MRYTKHLCEIFRETGHPLEVGIHVTRIWLKGFVRRMPTKLAWLLFEHLPDGVSDPSVG